MKTSCNIYILFVFFLPLLGYSQEKNNDIIKNDNTLSQIESVLPKGWFMYINNDNIIIEKKDSIKAVKVFRFNSPLIKMEKAERDAYIRKEGYFCKSRIIYRYEPIWDVNRIIEAKSSNDAIYAQYKNLPEKHKISDLKKTGGRNTNATYQPRNEVDKKNIKAYEEEKLLLEKKIIKLPNFSTNTYSLFFISREGYDDDNHIISPESASIELFTIENLFRELCGK